MELLRRNSVAAKILAVLENGPLTVGSIQHAVYPHASSDAVLHRADAIRKALKILRTRRLAVEVTSPSDIDSSGGPRVRYGISDAGREESRRLRETHADM